MASERRDSSIGSCNGPTTNANGNAFSTTTSEAERLLESASIANGEYINSLNEHHKALYVHTVNPAGAQKLEVAGTEECTTNERTENQTWDSRCTW